MKLILRFTVVFTEIVTALIFLGVIHKINVSWDMRGLMFIAGILMSIGACLNINEAGKDARLFDFDRRMS